MITSLLHFKTQPAERFTIPYTCTVQQYHINVQYNNPIPLDLLSFPDALAAKSYVSFPALAKSHVYMT